MIFEKIIGSVKNSPSKKIITVPYEWFEQHSKVLRKTASSGEEVGLRLSEHLYDGGVLSENDSEIIALALEPCELTRVFVSTMAEMGRACFELGNRHLPLEISETFVCTPYDNPTFVYMEKLGFKCERVTEKFTPTAGIHGHGHSHG
jgi:urease accessory protein